MQRATTRSVQALALLLLAGGARGQDAASLPLGSADDRILIEATTRRACLDVGLEHIQARVRFADDPRAWTDKGVAVNSAMLTRVVERWRAMDSRWKGYPAFTYCLAHLVPESVRWNWEGEPSSRTLLGFTYVFEPVEGGGRGAYTLTLDGDGGRAVFMKKLAACCLDTVWGQTAHLEAVQQAHDYAAVIAQAEPFLAAYPRSVVAAEMHREAAIAYEAWWSLGRLPKANAEWETIIASDPESFEPKGKGRYARDLESVRQRSLRHYRKALELRPAWSDWIKRVVDMLEQGLDTHQRAFVPTQC